MRLFLGPKSSIRQEPSVSLIGGFHFYSLALLFWFDLFLEAIVEILEKISLVIGEIYRHQKDILKQTELYWVENSLKL